MSAFDDAIAGQHLASDPGASTWLTANAGSGKTRVLTDRVARLLLEGVPPENILGLTFTKAAAGEMQNRLFGTLGKWAMADDGELRKALAGLGGVQAFDAEALARARRLFARAIDTPGGLKIQTIHAFAASLLRRFPLEAGVAPAFAELDDAAARDLRRDVLDEMAGDSAGAERLARLVAEASSVELTGLAADIARAAPDFAGRPDRAEIAAWFDVPHDLTEDALIASVVTPADASLAERVQPLLRAGKQTDIDLADELAAAPFDRPRAGDLMAMAKPFMTKDGKPRKGLATKDTTTALGEDAEALADLKERLIAALESLNRLQAVATTLALHDFARDFLSRYQARKAARGLLDFDDLIRHTSALLNRQDAANWVLYRLDGWIDHILVDEAQDTSPEQWQIIEALTREFSSGAGARSGVHRSLFVVGDPKQSIYGFQGADLAEFALRRDGFSGDFSGAGLAFAARSLRHSFRSSPLILDLVDRVAGASPGLGAAETHVSVREALPGRIDILDPALPPDKVPKPAFGDVESLPGKSDPAVLLADEMAQRIRDMLASEWICHHDAGSITRLKPGDILVLLRRRTRFMAPFVAACKRYGVPVAGADRIAIQPEVAVRDVMALLAFLDLPEDDLSLAEVLRSPLFGWSEQQLFTLAHHRGGTQTLWSAFRDGAAGWPEDVDRLERLLNLADFLRPFDLINHILVATGGRRQLAARLGPECHDALDALLDQALAYESLGPPSLTGFIAWFQSGETEVKRPVGQSANVVRIMTVHGAKGLEAPVVILPETGKLRAPNGPVLRKLDNGRPVIRPRAEARSASHQMMLDRDAAAEAEEDDRLLYVALTRPQSWLIVGAWNEVKDDGTSWYDRIVAGLSGMDGTRHEGFTRYSFADWPAPEPRPPEDQTAGPEITLKPVPRAARQIVFRAPSDLVPHGAVRRPSDDDARARGIFIHRLLEELPALPRGDWRDLAHQAAEHEVGYDAAAAADEALRVLDLPLFDAPSLAEGGVVADLPEVGGLPIAGRIDRVVEMGDHVLIVDYKSDRLPPARADETDPAYLAQMGAYLSALRQVLPEREVRVAILWTANASLMPLENEIVMTALAASTTS